IPREKKFRQRHDVGAAARGVGTGATRLIGVAGDITDGRIELSDGDRQTVGGPRIHGVGLARRARARQSAHSGDQISPNRSARASSQATAAMSSARPTAAEPMSLTRPIWGSTARLTRSASFSIAVFNSSTTRTKATTAMSARRFQASVATRKATGTARISAASSNRKASSLRAAARRPCQVLMVARSNRSIVTSGRLRCCLWLGGADRSWPRAEFDRSGRLERLAVEPERHDLLLDHALGQERAAVLAPGKPLTPVADFRLGQRHQLLAFDAQHLHQAVVVEERTVLRLVGSVPDVHGDKGAVGRERDPLRRLTDRDGMDDARRFCLEIDQADGVRIATAGPDIGD